MRSFSQDPEDKILWALISLGGKAKRSYLRRSLDMTLAELEPALVALESKKKIKRTDFEEKGKTNQMITLE
jgi:predicted DNA-binding protein